MNTHMATNHPPASELRQRQLRRMAQQQQHPSSNITHYALDLESPPVLACETRVPNAVYSTNPENVTCPDCKATEHFPSRSLNIQPEAAPTITAYNVLREAAWLLSDTGENPEYDRAIVELTSALIGAGQDDRILMTRILRSLAEGEL